MTSKRALIVLGVGLCCGLVAVVPPAAECESCGVSLAIPMNELWQGLRKPGWTLFSMQRGNELFATIEVVKIYNEARYSLEQVAAHYKEYIAQDVTIAGRFAVRTLNGIPVRWGRGRGKAEDGSQFLVHLVFFGLDDSHVCQLLAVVRQNSPDLHHYLIPEIIESLRRL
jgi:hypothetical protein